MFNFDKKIDKWSYSMIAGMNEVWGHNIDSVHDRKISMTTPFLVDYLDAYLAQYSQKIFDTFNSLTALEFKLEDFWFYINTTPVSLHNGKKKIVSISSRHEFFRYPTILIHELFHIYFFHYLRSNAYLKRMRVEKNDDLLTEEQENEIKEIITVIINDLFVDLIDESDNVYPHHRKIREEIFKLWRDGSRDFGLWLFDVVKIYKNG